MSVRSLRQAAPYLDLEEQRHHPPRYGRIRATRRPSTGGLRTRLSTQDTSWAERIQSNMVNHISFKRLAQEKNDKQLLSQQNV